MLKKKSFWLVVFAFILILPAVVMLSACEQHIHIFDTKWTSNELYHWHSATATCSYCRQTYTHDYDNYLCTPCGGYCTLSGGRYTCNKCGTRYISIRSFCTKCTVCKNIS